MASSVASSQSIIAKALELVSKGEMRQGMSGAPVEWRNSIGDFTIDLVWTGAPIRPAHVAIQVDRWEVFRATLKSGFESDLSRHELQLMATKPNGWRERFVSIDRNREANSAQSSHVAPCIRSLLATLRTLEARRPASDPVLVRRPIDN